MGLVKQDNDQMPYFERTELFLIFSTFDDISAQPKEIPGCRHWNT